ncbi:MAG: hypothetical protein AB198_02090 [Parcubacteria bacterium C7867-003]|nr:MAG: hypothetical protein AB198_02090 [Parcubacteria bacterium C7867-003]
MRHESAKIILWIIGIFIVISLLMGGSSDSNNGSKVYIDCTQPVNSSSPYCDGSYESSIQEQDATENSYYQNLGR